MSLLPGDKVKALFVESDRPENYNNIRKKQYITAEGIISENDLL